MNLDDNEKERIKRDIQHKEAEIMRMKYSFFVLIKILFHTKIQTKETYP